MSSTTVGLDLAGTSAYLADGEYGLRILDITDPRSPNLVASAFTGGQAEDVVVRENRAYLADGEKGLAIFDVQNPKLPVLLGTYDSAHYANDIWVESPVAYLVDDAGGLINLDVSNPYFPAVLGGYQKPKLRGNAVWLQSNRAYLAWGEENNINRGGLVILDVADPSHPKVLVNHDVGEFIYNLALQGNRAYLSGGTAVRILDVSDPGNLILIAQHTTLPEYSILAVNEQLFIGSEKFLLFTSIDELGDINPNFFRREINGNIHDMKSFGGLLALAGLDSGFFILDGVVSPCSTTCGNGKIESPETCDDGNFLLGDGCNATCTGP